MKIGRVVLFVIDGLGTGSADKRHHTTRTILNAVGPEAFPHLSRLGLRRYTAADHTPLRLWPHSPEPDSFLGHLEMAGAQAMPELQQLDDVRDNIANRLSDCTFGPGGTLLTRHGTIAVYDTLDAMPGLGLTVLGGSQTSEGDLFATARAVREVVNLPRVIACHIPHIDLMAALATHGRVENSPIGLRHGLNDRKSGIFSPPYSDRHLPAPISPDNLLTQLSAARIPITLIGKTVDVFADVVPGATMRPAIESDDVARHLQAALSTQTSGLVFVNDRQTDLAAHTGNATSAASALSHTDNTIGETLRNLNRSDILIVTADHGNDPASGSNHTYESVPLLSTQTLPDLGHASLMFVAEYLKKALAQSN